MIIIIGGTGFIGKHLCCAIQKSGKKAICYSNNPDIEFLSENSPSTKGRPISKLFADNENNILEEAQAVIYLASRSYPALINNSASFEVENNIRPAIKAFDHILSLNNKAKIIYLSSGGTIYGSGHTIPIKESSPLKPSTPYSFGKIAIEQYLQLLNASKNIDYTILRASNPVGKWHANPRQGFIGASITNIKLGKPLEIFGDGETIRDYIDADELSSAIIKIVDNHDASKNKIWNIGSGIGASLNDIATNLKKITGSDFQVNYTASRNVDLRYNVLDCSKISKELNWKSELILNDILSKAWNESNVTN